MDLVANPAVEPFLVVPEEGPLSARAREIGMPFDTLALGAVSTVRRPFRLRDGIAVTADFWKAARKLNEIARRRGVALVHSNGLKAHAVALAARRLGGKPTVIHIRDIANTGLEKAVWRGFQMASDRTILISGACWPGGTLPSNTHVVHNAFMAPAEPAESPGEPPFVTGFVGRIHPHKGLHVLITAIGRARGQGASVRLIVRGAFAPETPGYEDELRRQVADLGLENHVEFAGYVSDPERVYDGMHVVCMPSIMPEPFGRAAMEAMGRGMAVIASPCGGVPELIEDGRTGLFATTAEEITEQLLRLERDRDYRRGLGQRAREYCIANLSLSRLHENVSKVYQLALRQPVGPGSG